MGEAITNEQFFRSIQEYETILEDGYLNEVENSEDKSFVDVVSGGVIGPGIAAVGGQFLPMVGIALIIAGHYLGDKSGVLRTTGASSLAFGIAKSHSYRNILTRKKHQNTCPFHFQR